MKQLFLTSTDDGSMVMFQTHLGLQVSSTLLASGTANHFIGGPIHTHQSDPPDESDPLKTTNTEHRIATRADRFGTPDTYTRILNGRSSQLDRKNPIQRLFSIEAPLVTEAMRNEAETILQSTKIRVAERLHEGALSPGEILLVVYEILKDSGMKFVSPEDKKWGRSVNEPSSLFTQNLINGFIDCDDIAFIYLSLAHEFQWPLKLTASPDHLAVFWDDGVHERLYFDGGEVLYIDFFKKEHNIEIEELTPQQIVGFFYFNRGMAHYHNGKREAAITDYDKAIRRYNLKYSSAYQNRGVVKYEIDQSRNAIRDFDKALRIHKSAETYENLGKAKYDIGDYRGAITDFLKAMALGAQSANLHYDLGIAYIAVAKTEEDWRNILGEFNCALELQEDFLEASYERGVANFKLGNFEAAVEDFQKVLSKNENDCYSHFYLAHTLRELGRMDEARYHSNRAVAIDPQRIRIHIENLKRDAVS